ncbi:anti-sigma factor [Neolewinella agarilytica]|uniref:Uncharacterized protein n=1 Tax=Neolewinella agarilytica TaxID=478744 RepID=A0A1H9N3G5_9BACT|nr:anti-sigma factor [Neolewinella agarilytica]SER30229.1 hypothetical protein SAMN05444359_13330 [Neolewinella agarilytica]
MTTDNLEDFILNNREAFDEETPSPDIWNRIESAIHTDGDDDNDPFEAFVASNRDAFDDSTPPPRLEGRIFAALGEQAGASPMPPMQVVHRRRRLMPVLGIAASMLLLITAAFLIGNNRGYQTGSEEQLAAELDRIDPELAETESYYRETIAENFTKVSQVNHDPQLVKDLEAIDEATAEIRANLLEVPASQRPALVQKLIETYRTKLDILLRIQQHLPSPSTTTQQPNNEL